MPPVTAAVLDSRNGEAAPASFLMIPFPLDFLVTSLVTLLVVIDPVGLAPTFLAVTDGMSAAERRRVALRACLIAAAILMGAPQIGDWLLRTLSISLPAFRIAGGLLLFSIASEMVFGVRIARACSACCSPHSRYSS